MSDTTTPSNDGSAMSLREGIAALNATRTSDQAVSEAARTLSNARNVKQQEVEEPLVEQPGPDEPADGTEEPETVDDQQDDEQEFLETEPEEQEAIPESDGALLTLDDGTKLTEEEIKKSFLRESDYTRKTQKLAQERKAVESEAKARLGRLDAALASLKPEPEPNWELLSQEDPDWSVKKLQYDKRNAERMNAVNILQSEQQNILANQKKQAVYDLQSGSYIPEWKNPEVLSKDLDITSKFAVEHLGFGADELDAIADPRAIQALDMARRYFDQKGKIKTAEKRVANKPKAIKAGRKSGIQSGVQKGVAQAQAAFDKNPTKANAAAIFRARRAAQARK
tara:strand:- start:479 stop:1495 length:1017 start_codon:yes stop_codon:yes gene_type:complete